MFLSLGNLTLNPRVGLLFIDFEGQKRLRLERPRVASTTATRCSPSTSGRRRSCGSRRCASIPNCPRYIHKLQLVERSRFTPRTDCEPPVPDWKRREWARDVLAAGDPANES